MREAFGGAFSIKLMMIFLVLYVCFICVGLNYSRAYRVKNRIINIIEQNEGINYNNTQDAVILEIQNYLRGTGYSIALEDREMIRRKSECISNGGSIIDPGFCVSEINNGEYYLVETYTVLRLPFNLINTVNVVKGETRKIERA